MSPLEFSEYQSKLTNIKRTIRRFMQYFELESDAQILPDNLKRQIGDILEILDNILADMRVLKKGLKSNANSH